MHATSRYGLRIPDGTDSDNPPLHIGYLASDVEARLGAVEDGPKPRHAVFNAVGSGSLQPNNNTAAGGISVTMPACTALVCVSLNITAFTAGNYLIAAGIRVGDADYFGPTLTLYAGSGGGQLVWSATYQVPFTAGVKNINGRLSMGSAPAGVDWRYVSVSILAGAALS